MKKQKNKIKAIFFDFDMTLVDSMPTATASYEGLSRATGIKPTKKGFQEYIGRKFSDSLDFFSKNKKINKKLLTKVYLLAHTRNLSKVSVYGRKALNFLKNNNIKIIIISRNRKDVLKIETKALKIPYDLIFGDEDMKKGEEKHELMLRIIKKLKLRKDEVFYIGDHINDIKEAKKASIPMISVTTGVFNASELMRYDPDFILDDLNNLIKILINSNKTA